eukprot:CAMPEP_0205806134 /NCGR_PEP_ID=MMETSP0205-20121125/9566_1 /ASSEMBLY_ACC=CAM_ASM_000278 /TAXON_ID=36767 /ORGANISM="Euplotes focardii, Strain TN1" /LENGTH=60 /DNA_ID=CAMNT_0053078465 /DNA_START=529 /DNA_END=707 /DNA_ORIENTATION=-
MSFPDEKISKDALKNFDEKSEKKSLEKDFSRLMISIVRNMVDLLLPLHYLGIRKMTSKNV